MNIYKLCWIVLLSRNKETGSTNNHNSQTRFQSKGISTASSEDEQLARIKLERANKYLEAFKHNEINLTDRIRILEESKQELKQQLSNMQDSYDSLKSINKALIDKLKCETWKWIIPSKAENKWVLQPDPLPSYVLAMQYNELLDNDDYDNWIEQSSEKMFQSVHSTDENYIGMVDNKPKVYMNKTEAMACISK